MTNDFYAVLGVPRNATTEQIRARFLQLTREQHPDRYVGAKKVEAEDAFQEVTQAFNILTNPNRRREHDMELARPSDGKNGNLDELVRAYMQRGVKDYKARNYTAAADNFKRATDADPNSAKAWHHLALACSHEPRWISQATEAIAKACELEPMKATYQKLAGTLFARAGNKEKAVQFFRQALQWGGDDPEIESMMAEIQGRKKSLLGGIFSRSD